MRGCLRPSVRTTTIFKNFLIIPLKATITKIHLHHINKKISSFASRYRQLWQAADQRKRPLAAADHRRKPVCTFLPASSLAEQTGEENLAG
jgi:hypothetical protein